MSSGKGISRVQVPPHSIPDEMLVLGAMLAEPDLLTTCRQVLTADDFFHPHHRTLYQAACDTEAERGEPFSLMAVTHVLRNRHQLDEIGGHAFLCGLVNGVSTTASLPYHVRVVAAKGQARRVATLALSLYELAIADTGWQAALKDLAEVIPIVLRTTPNARPKKRLSTVAV